MTKKNLQTFHDAIESTAKRHHHLHQCKIKVTIDCGSRWVKMRSNVRTALFEVSVIIGLWLHACTKIVRVNGVGLAICKIFACAYEHVCAIATVQHRNYISIKFIYTFACVYLWKSDNLSIFFF